MTPGLINAIAEHIRFSVDIRAVDPDVFERVTRDIVAFAERRRRTAGCAPSTYGASTRCRHRWTSASSPLEQAAAQGGEPFLRMSSGAGHDTMCIADRVPSAMLFAPARTASATTRRGREARGRRGRRRGRAERDPHARVSLKRASRRGDLRACLAVSRAGGLAAAPASEFAFVALHATKRARAPAPVAARRGSRASSRGTPPSRGSRRPRRPRSTRGRRRRSRSRRSR